MQKLGFLEFDDDDDDDDYDDLIAATNLGGSPSRARDWPCCWPTPPLSRDCICNQNYDNLIDYDGNGDDKGDGDGNGKSWCVLGHDTTKSSCWS